MAASSVAPALDDCLRRFAGQHRRRGVRSIYALTEPALPERTLVFCTLSAAEVGRQRLSEVERKKLPGYLVLCFRMGRLACRADQRRLGIGKLLLGCAADAIPAAWKWSGGDFEMYRRQHKNIVDAITYDELLRRHDAFMRLPWNKSKEVQLDLLDAEPGGRSGLGWCVLAGGSR